MTPTQTHEIKAAAEALASDAPIKDTFNSLSIATQDAVAEILFAVALPSPWGPLVNLDDYRQDYVAALEADVADADSWMQS